MNCKNCSHKVMCKYAEDFTAVEKKLNEAVKEATDGLPFKTNVSLTFECGLCSDTEASAPAKKEAPKRKRRTKAEIEADNLKKSSSVEKVKEELKKQSDLAKEMNIPSKTSEEKKEEVKTEVKSESAEDYFASLDDRKKALLDIGLVDMIEKDATEEEIAEITATGIKLVRDTYNKTLADKLSASHKEIINKKYKVFGLKEI